MEARCQCGSVSFKTPLPQPLALYICHCVACRRQTGSAFGTSAIFPRFKLPETDNLSCYRLIRRGLAVDLQSRDINSTATFVGIAEPDSFTRRQTFQTKNVVSVKGGCLEGLDWKRAIHIWTSSAMVPIPEDSETHSEESGYTDYGSTQEDLDQPGDLVGSGGCNMTSSAKPEGVSGACELSG
ncbi:glutathione-dependent formaldehyde-activating [Fusarium albosuccineum]|uniref:Glutathione-dependent formaldehyde-activating n=1 Tax=Fusarium albosuccineum TaxID=1237068 RepID=A0A8H4K536_9HYPO|nr:glutathione-dependent formaldehyde-activating [Fusarium albosuccineum]KAF4988199.1 hypothetical protein FDECE_15153 [Fusarium decemcellulare]